jgi:hypothetical protein
VAGGKLLPCPPLWHRSSYGLAVACWAGRLTIQRKTKGLSKDLILVQSRAQQYIRQVIKARVPSEQVLL